ncbi:phosphoglucomutase [Olsenella sp. An290]|uniref:phosphoglucomutase n=1 Tax=Olsenella sp. An290 TaxID=1965625 RepID=UPI000B3AC7F0|nr:phosphoglucomutase [Olsenella sp. An290]OUO34730.1 phosphoglucomutase [Olsenella sp. An290]
MDRRAEIIRFGADGWHARFDDDFTEKNVTRVADALGLVWANATPGATVYVGFDTRHDARRLAAAAAGVLASYGLRARVSEAPCPTPALAWSCARDEAAVGAVMLTASERSCEYGGILVRGGDGGPVSRSFLDEVEQAISLEPTAEGGPFEECDLTSSYLTSLHGLVRRDAIAAARPKVVVDPMFGASTGLLSQLLSDLGCDVVEIHVERREDFGGIHPEPADPWADACEQAVVAHGAALGVLLDGDGDRAAVVDERGAILPARVLVPLLLGWLVEGHGARGRVVTTLTCSATIGHQAERLGCETTSVPVGFSRIYRETLEKDVVMGVEEYGGVCIPGHLRERDGLLVCLLAVEMLACSGKTMSQMAAELEAKIGATCYARRDLRLDPAVSQALRNVLPGLNPGELAGRAPVEVSHADGLRAQFEDDSWVLIRPSRTSSVVRVYAEAPSAPQRDALLEAACDLVREGL